MTNKNTLIGKATRAFIKCSGSKKNKNKKYPHRNALIAIVVCAVVVGLVPIEVLAAGNDEDTTIWVTATETCYGTSGVYQYIEYIYDDDYLLISKIIYDAPGGEQSGITNYTYDENGYMIFEDTSYADGSKEHCEYTYDESGNMISEIRTSTDDPDHHYEYTYDESGNVISEILFDSDGLLGYSTEYTYDKNGNMILKETTSSAGGGSHEEYIYDDGNLTEVNVFSLNGTQVYHAELICDRNGNVILDLTWTMDDSLAHRAEYVYDENNNMISDILIFSTNVLEERHDYTYYSYEAPTE